MPLQEWVESSVNISLVRFTAVLVAHPNIAPSIKSERFRDFVSMQFSIASSKSKQISVCSNFIWVWIKCRAFNLILKPNHSALFHIKKNLSPLYNSMSLGSNLSLASMQGLTEVVICFDSLLLKCVQKSSRKLLMASLSGLRLIIINKS